MCHSTKPVGVLTIEFYRHPQRQIVREIPVHVQYTVFINILLRSTWYIFIHTHYEYEY